METAKNAHFAQPTGPRRRGGFTLIEMMIVLTVGGILIAMAYPSYMTSVRKGRRADAIGALSQLQMAQERYRSNHPTYGSLADLGIAATTEGGYYTLSVSGVTATTYNATATAVSGKSQTQDTADGVSCATLRVNQDEAVYIPAGQSACWSR